MGNTPKVILVTQVIVIYNKQKNKKKNSETLKTNIWSFMYHAFLFSDIFIPIQRFCSYYERHTPIQKRTHAYNHTLIFLLTRQFGVHTNLYHF